LSEEIVNISKEKEIFKRKFENEEKNVQDLEHLVQTMNENRTEMQNEIAQLNLAKEQLQVEIQAFSNEKKYLSETRQKGLSQINNALSNAYREPN